MSTLPAFSPSSGSQLPTGTRVRFATAPVQAVLLTLLASCATTTGPRPGAPGVGDPYYPSAGNGGYQVEHYDLELDVDFEGGRLAGRTTIDAVATHGLTTFNLDLRGFDVREVWVDRRPAAIQRSGDELVVQPAEPLAAGAEFRVLVVYEGEPGVVPDPGVSFVPGVGWDQRDDSVYVLSQPSGARGFFPCNDHPSDKATYTMRIAVPEAYTVAANGSPDGVGWRDGKRVWSWSSRDPMASYLVTIAIDRFDVEVTEGPNGLPLRHYFPEGTEAELRAPFAQTTPMLEFFTERFGPYPFESCGGVLSKRTDLGGALETQTLPVYGYGAGQEHVIAHELAHQWFGNDVSLERWSDIWINEGIAEYLAILWTRETQGEEFYQLHLAKLHTWVQRNQFGPPLDPGVENLFSGAVYLRGALAAHALHRAAGEEVFLAILRTYRERYSGRSAGIEDFYAVVEELAGREVLAELVTWLTQPVPPVIPELEEIEEEAAAETLEG